MALFSNTFSVIRQYLSSQVGDLILSTAVAPLGDYHYTDSSLRKADNYYQDHQYRGYCYYGTAKGQEREVYDWVYANRTILFAPPFSPSLVADDKFELHYIFFADEYLRAINLGIESIAGKYLIDIKDESIPLVANTYEYELPLSMLYLYRVITENVADDGKFYNEAIIDPRYYSIIKSYPPKLKLDKRYYSITADKHLRLEGQGTQPLVDDDADIIYLPPKWLVAEAILNLPRSKIQSNKLDGVYAQAEKDAWLYRQTARNWPNPRARSVVE